MYKVKGFVCLFFGPQRSKGQLSHVSQCVVVVAVTSYASILLSSTATADGPSARRAKSSFEVMVRQTENTTPAETHFTL